MEMFADSFKCKECQKQLDCPVLLPCGNSICQKHVNNEMKEHSCVSCKKAHPIPADNEGFYLNKALKHIIDVSTEKRRQCPEYNQAYESHQELENLLDVYQQLKSQKHYFINETIASLKNEIDILREEIKLKIDLETQRIVNFLTEYEQECLQSPVDLAPRLAELDDVAKEIENGLNDFRLHQFDADKLVFKDLQEKGDLQFLHFEKLLSNFQDELFLNRLEKYLNNMLVNSVFVVVPITLISAFIKNLRKAEIKLIIVVI
jgi:hypothetical protein